MSFDCTVTLYFKDMQIDHKWARLEKHQVQSQNVNIDTLSTGKAKPLISFAVECYSIVHQITLDNKQALLSL